MLHAKIAELIYIYIYIEREREREKERERRGIFGILVLYFLLWAHSESVADYTQAFAKIYVGSLPNFNLIGGHSYVDRLIGLFI